MAVTTVAVVGCGKATGAKEGWAIGHDHAAGWLTAAPAIRLLGVDPSEENLAAFGSRFGLPPENLFPSTEALYAAAEPDFVSVCTWPALHAPMVIEAAARGARGIVCEKPMATSVGEIRSMLAACAASGTRLAIGHQRRYDPLFQMARQLIRDGAIGDGLVLEARVCDDWDLLSWTVHWFDMANFLFDATPSSILAGVDHTGQRRYGQAIEIRSIVFAEYAAGRQAIFVTGPNHPAGDAVVVRGSRGLIRVGAQLEVFSELGSVVHEREVPMGGGFGALMRDLLRVAGTDEPMLCGAEQCAIATEMAYAAHESARTLHTVTLPLATEYAPLEIVQQGPRLGLPPGRVVLLSDGHSGSGGPEGLAEAMATLTGAAPLMVEPTTPITTSALADASLLVLYHSESHVDAETQVALTDWVQRGRPLILVHSALGAWPGWDDYCRWACRIWRWGPDGSVHPLEPAQLRVVPGSPFHATWNTADLPRDEVYMALGETDRAIDLLTAHIAQGTVPAAWLSTRHPNVGAWMPGHRGDSWSVPAMRDGFAHLIRACAFGMGR